MKPKYILNIALATILTALTFCKKTEIPGGVNYGGGCLGYFIILADHEYNMNDTSVIIKWYIPAMYSADFPTCLPLIEGKIYTIYLDTIAKPIIIAGIIADTSEYKIKNLIPNKKYYYEVHALDTLHIEEYKGSNNQAYSGIRNFYTAVN